MFRKQNVTGTYTHVYSCDPSIDTESNKFDHEQFLRTGDEKFLPLKNGGKPVMFELKHLSGREKLALNTIFSVYEKEEASLMFYDIVALALKDMKEARLDTGEEVEVTHVFDKRMKVQFADRKSVDLIGSVDNGRLLYELGNRVVKETFGDPLSSRE